MTSKLEMPRKRVAYLPDDAVPPGRTLQETIDKLGIDQRELAERTGLSVKHVNQVIKGVATLTPDTAIRLERVTGVPAKYWNNLEADYQTHQMRAAQRNQSQTPSVLAWLKTIPTKELIHRGRIADSKEPAELLEQVLRFFGVASVEAWKAGWDKPQFAFRKSPAFEGQKGAMAAWLRLCELAAARLDCKPFHKKRFQAILKQIRSLTVEEPDVFLPAMASLCREAGVAAVLVREIKGAPVSGAAKWLSPRKAMIGLTLRGGRDDRLWFSFFHEAGHLLHDSKKETYIDVDAVDDPREQRANQFAANLLIPPARAGELANLKTEAEVLAFARQQGIAPGIIVGRLQHDGTIPYSQWNGLKKELKWSDEA